MEFLVVWYNKDLKAQVQVQKNTTIETANLYTYLTIHLKISNSNLDSGNMLTEYGFLWIKQNLKS